MMDVTEKNVTELSDEDLISAARRTYQDEGILEIDDGAPVSRGADDGAYVQAWVWVQCKQPEED